MAGVLPVADRLHGQAGLGAMVRQNLGLAVRKLGEALAERCGDLGMQLLTAAFK